MQIRRLVACILPVLALLGAAPASFGDAGSTVRTGFPTFPMTATAPGAVTNLSSVRGDATIDVTFTPPANDGGDAIIGYEASTDAANWFGIATSAGAQAGTLTATVGGLNDGETYVVQVRAVNNIGRGPAASAPAAKPAQTPSAPGISLTPGNGRIDVDFTPSFDGGEPVLRWEITLNGGGSFQTFTPTAGPNGHLLYSATGLANGTDYHVGVRGVNVVGEGFSGKSMSVTPARVPDAPTNLHAVRDNGGLYLTFTIPASDGGDAISTTRSPATTAPPGPRSRRRRAPTRTRS